jgi:5'-nucleotidase
LMQKILYVDMDNVLVDFQSAFSHIPAEVLSEFEGRLDEVPGIFSLMEPMPFAIESFQELANLFDTYILSTSPWENPSAWSDKLLWVKHHLGSICYKRLILTHHKNLNVGHFLVDDRTKNGVDRFVGEHIEFGATQFPDWPPISGNDHSDQKLLASFARLLGDWFVLHPKSERISEVASTRGVFIRFAAWKALRSRMGRKCRLLLLDWFQYSL